MQGKYVSVEKYCTADLLQNNRLLSIYPIRPKTSTTAELDSTTTTARPFPNEDDLFSEDYFEDRAEQTFPRWQNFPFSAESIQVIFQLNFLKDQGFHWNFCCQNGIPELLTKNNLATFHAWPQRVTQPLQVNTIWSTCAKLWANSDRNKLLITPLLWTMLSEILDDF